MGVLSIRELVSWRERRPLSKRGMGKRTRRRRRKRRQRLHDEKETTGKRRRHGVKGGERESSRFSASVLFLLDEALKKNRPQFCCPSASASTAGGVTSLERLFFPQPPPLDFTGVAVLVEVQLLPPDFRPPQTEPPDAQPEMWGCSMWPLPQSTAETPGTYAESPPEMNSGSAATSEFDDEEKSATVVGGVFLFVCLKKEGQKRRDIGLFLFLTSC